MHLTLSVENVQSISRKVSFMAERRMFTKTIIDSDAFLDMPLSAQALYFHLSMRADDDGFLNNAKKVMKIIGANQNDYDLLIAKNFVIIFADGICVIKHWRMHNYIQKDRYKETVYQEHKKQLLIKDNKAYTLDASNKNECIQDVYTVDTQDRLGKDRLGKDSIGKDRLGYISMSDESDSLEHPIDKIDYKAIMEYWNKYSLLKEISGITDKRKGNINARIKEHGQDAIFKTIDNVANSKFLRGHNNKNWMASFDWVFLPNNFIKVLEGNYLDIKTSDHDEIEERTQKVYDFYNIGK